MTSEQAIKILTDLQASQDKALAVVKLEGSAGHLTLYDFAGIASLIERLQKMANFVGGSPSPIPWDQIQQKYVDEIERLQEENDELKSRMPSETFSDYQLFGPRPQGRL